MNLCEYKSLVLYSHQAGDVLPSSVVVNDSQLHVCASYHLHLLIPSAFTTAASAPDCKCNLGGVLYLERAAPQMLL